MEVRTPIDNATLNALLKKTGRCGAEHNNLSKDKSDI
jgi:hypothetical protein